MANQIYFVLMLAAVFGLSAAWLNPECKTNDLEYKYNATLNRCYKFRLTPGNWSEALAACYEEGSYLAILNSADEAAHLAQITADADKDDVQGLTLIGALLLGFYSDEVYINFRTIEGQTLEEAGYAVWGAGNPNNNRGPELCGSMFYEGTLNDLGCYWKCFSICERNV